MDLTRRRLLSGGTALVATGWGGSRIGRASPRSTAAAFTPVENGYGFPNWSSQTQYFDPPPNPPHAAIRERIRTEWRSQARAVLDIDPARFPAQLIDGIATQVRLAIVQRAGTNGHCYGMSLTAQRYFDRPEEIPVDRRVASEIEDPTVPVEEPVAPVYEQIVEMQAAQFLRFRAWLGRRAMLHPEWIDTANLLRDVRAVVESRGTATLSLFDDTLYGHQVLAYGYREDDDGVTIPIYDPNRSAVTYRGDRPRLRFEDEDGTLSMRRYERHTHVLFNRYDQIERSTGRDDASPLDHLTVDRSTLRASLFPLVLVLVDTADVDLTVADPDGEEIDRIQSTYMDRTRGAYARVRSRYGAAPGTYRIDVFGANEADYELTVLAADPDGTIVDDTQSARIELGGHHEYEVTIPEEGTGTTERTGGGWSNPAIVGGAGTIGGAAIGGLGYRTLQRGRRTDDD